MKVIFGLVLAGLVLLGSLFLFSRKLLYFPERVGKARLERIRSGMPGVEEVRIEGAGRVVLHGWIINKDMAGLPTVFYFGGNAEEVSLNLEDFIRLEANAVLVNYRGYGLSGGAPAEAALKADALAVYDRLAKQYTLSAGNCVAWGRSLGSSMASFLALERGLGRLILTCPFDSIQGVAAAYYPSWLVRLVLKDTHRTVDFAGRIRSRTLILASPRDEVIPKRNTVNLYEGLACEKELKYIPGTGHNTISEGAGYFEAVAEFLR